MGCYTIYFYYTHRNISNGRKEEEKKNSFNPPHTLGFLILFDIIFLASILTIVVVPGSLEKRLLVIFFFRC